MSEQIHTNRSTEIIKEVLEELQILCKQIEDNNYADLFGVICI